MPPLHWNLQQTIKCSSGDVHADHRSSNLCSRSSLSFSRVMVVIQQHTLRQHTLQQEDVQHTSTHGTGTGTGSRFLR